MSLPLAEDVGARWMAAMRAGDWEAAWQQTDRLELPRRVQQQSPGFVRRPEHLVWDGRPFTGRSVLVRCLHGLGDTLQYLRFVPQVAAQARELHFLVQPMLLPLLEGLAGLGHVSNAWTDDPPVHELEIEVMELAYALRSTAHTVPAPYPHLAPRVRGTLALDWPQDGLPRVGLLWAASDWDTSRSVTLELLAPLLAVAGVHFYSLQQGAAAQHPGLARRGLVPLSRHTERVEAAAAAMLEMDLIIAVDGMPAHLAGTLGRPTWLLLKHEADWRWMRGCEDSPWYPSMRLYRQPSPGDWEGAVRRMATDLHRLVGSPTRGTGACLPAAAAPGRTVG